MPEEIFCIRLKCLLKKIYEYPLIQASVLADVFSKQRVQHPPGTFTINSEECLGLDLSIACVE